MTREDRLLLALPIVLGLVGVGLALHVFQNGATERDGSKPSYDLEGTPPEVADNAAPPRVDQRSALAAAEGDEAHEPTAAAPPVVSAAVLPAATERPTAPASEKATDPDAPCAALAHKLAYLPERVGHCDRDRCRRAGGECGAAGLHCTMACLARAVTANQTCHDASDCDSDCVAPEGSNPGDRVTGRCYHLALAHGCLPRVRDGVHAGVICIE